MSAIAPRASLRGRAARALAIALGIALVAVVFRCWRWATVPPGLYVDELLTARNALLWRLDAHASWLGSRPLIFAGWVETSNLYLAFASALLHLGGDGLLGARLVSIVPSLAGVPLLFLLGRELGGRRAAAGATLLFACSHWAARTGRTGWDAVLLLAVQLAAFTALAAALRRREEGRRAILLAMLGGLLVGIGLFTYIASRLVVALALLWLAVEAWCARGERPRATLRIALAAVVGLLVAGGPWALHVLRRPELLAVRVRELSVLDLHGAGEPWRTIGTSLLAHALMFHGRGGAYARDALPGFPMLDPLTGAAMLAGIAVVAWRGQSAARRLLVLWPLVMVLGGVLSHSAEGPPYPYRVLALAPWACLLAGIGAASLWDAARERLPPALASGVAVVILAAIVLWNGWALFVAGPRFACEERVYGTVETVIGRALLRHRDRRPVLVLAAVLPSYPPPSARAPHGSCAFANPTDFYRPVDAIAAIQLVSGVWARDPRRARDPLRSAGDVDLVTALPSALARPTLLVVPPAELALAARYTIERTWLLRSPAGKPVAMLVEAR